MTTPVLNADDIQVGTANGPGIYIAPEGTPAPTDTTSPWPEPWESLGYLSDDGPTVSSSVDTEDIKPWQSRSPVRTVITGRAMTLQFVMWELNEKTLAVYFDADEAVPADDGSLAMQIRTDQPQHLHSVGIDTADGDKCMRLVFRRASLSDAGDMSITQGAAIPLDVTLSALDDNGVLADLLLGPSGTGTATPPPNTVTVTSPGPQATVVDTAIVPLNIVADSTGGGVLSYSAAGLPAGLAIAPVTGAITGTPTAVEEANVTVTVTDDTAASGTADFTWSVTATAQFGARNSRGQ